ncbi:hypothetical protein [Mucilaginibacter sp. OK098]|uniref:hypothetical protein n=1 Tax=Mucilaginibacter sp. OK098 TaxID=1855297 RepID=UPI0013567041|nr:hypothetical protein [Mucilaginibacter sp. OK098]
MAKNNASQLPLVHTWNKWNRWNRWNKHITPNKVDLLVINPAMGLQMWNKPIHFW